MADYDPDNHFLAGLGMYDVPTPAGADLAMALPVHPRVANPRGGLQGGLIATLIDVTAGRAALALAGPGHGVPTADLHLRFLSPVTDGPAVAVARVLRRGRQQIVLQVDVRDEGRDVLAATATVAFSIVTSRPGQDEGGRIFPAREA
jgi:uncharacterized protein (TIGR00369 family)